MRPDGVRRLIGTHFVGCQRKRSAVEENGGVWKVRLVNRDPSSASLAP